MNFKAAPRHDGDFIFPFSCCSLAAHLRVDDTCSCAEEACITARIEYDDVHLFALRAETGLNLNSLWKHTLDDDKKKSADISEKITQQHMCREKRGAGDDSRDELKWDWVNIASVPLLWDWELCRWNNNNATLLQHTQQQSRMRTTRREKRESRLCRPPFFSTTNPVNRSALFFWSGSVESSSAPERTQRERNSDSTAHSSAVRCWHAE